MSESKELPKGWAEASLEEVSVVDWGNTSLTKKAYVEDGKYLAVSAAGCDGRIDFAEHKRHTPVISAIGTCGVVHYPQEDFTAIKNTITLTPREGLIHDGFLFHVLTAVRLPQRGSNQRFIAKGDVQAFCVPIAPLPEQHRIVEKVEELFSDLDAGVSALQRAKANLKRYRASVLKTAVEGRLTEEWRKEHPQTEDGQMLLDRILRELREKWEKEQLQKFKEKGKEPPKNWQSKYEEPTHEAGLYDLPSSWAWASALEVCERVENGNTPPSDEMSSGTGDVPFIKVYNLTRDGRLDFTVSPTFVSQKTHAERLGRSRVLPHDVLMNIVGPPLGKVSLVPETYSEWNMNQAIVLFRTSDVVLSRYLALCLMSDEVLRWITRTAKATAGQFNISVSNSRILPIPLPPLAEQEQIVALVEERLSQIDSAEKTIDAELIRAKRLRQSILKQAFEGKLVPQDPKDEPASVLLERIKASREAEQPKKKATKAKAK
jgi:type I restriction enzyme S subunit